MLTLQSTTAHPSVYLCLGHLIKMHIDSLPAAFLKLHIWQHSGAFAALGLELGLGKSILN